MNTSKWQEPGIRYQVTVNVALLVVFTLALFGFPLAYLVDRNYEDREVITLEGEAARTGLSVRNAISQANISQVEIPADPMRDVGVYGPDAKLVTGEGPAVGDSVVATALRNQLSKANTRRSIAVAVPLVRYGEVVAVVRVSIQKSQVHSSVRKVWIVMAVGAAAILLLTTVVGRLLSRRFMRSVSWLAESSELLGSGSAPPAPFRIGTRELDALATSLVSAANRIEETLRREREFSADASHQLLTPLAALRLNVERLLDDDRTELDSTLRSVLSDIDRMERTVADLLPSQRSNADRAPLNIVDFQNEFVSHWRPMFEQKQRELVLLRDGELPAVLVNQAALRQAIDVMLDNSLTHGSGAVTVRMRATGGGLAIDVFDEGQQTIDHMGRVFDRGVGDNNGIGLALARSLVENEGGRLILRSAGPPPVFSILFPESQSESSNR